MFSRNITTFDRNLRIAAGLMLDMWFFSGWLDGSLRWAIGILCILLLSTASASYCPLYNLRHLIHRALASKAHDN